MSRCLWMLLLLSSTASAADARWMAVARDADTVEVRDLALALATGGADPSVERAAAKLILTLRAEVEGDLAVADALTADLRVERAREVWRQGDSERAVRLLEPVREDPIAALLYAEAVDSWVSAERERLGEVYFQARSGPRAERAGHLHEVQRGLSALIESYPESVYSEPLADNLERVERELDLLW